MFAEVYVSRNANDEAAGTVVPRSGGLHPLRRCVPGLWRCSGLPLRAPAFPIACRALQCSGGPVTQLSPYAKPLARPPAVSVNPSPCRPRRVRESLALLHAPHSVSGPALCSGPGPGKRAHDRSWARFRNMGPASWHTPFVDREDVPLVRV